jgi:hypothetical protein
MQSKSIQSQWLHYSFNFRPEDTCNLFVRNIINNLLDCFMSRPTNAQFSHYKSISVFCVICVVRLILQQAICTSGLPAEN